MAMIHLIAGGALFLLVAAVAAILFLFWIAASIIGFSYRALFGGRGSSRQTPAVNAGERICPRDHCRARNLAEAKFCRRCGSSLTKDTPALRRVAS